MSAVLAIARVELRHRWRGLVLLGVFAGVVGGCFLGSLEVARRTSTAPDRLAAASHVDDARVTVFGGTALAEQVAALPSVDDAWTAGIHIGQVVGDDVSYAAVLAGPTSDDVFTPVVVRGRATDPSRPDEVVVTEPFAKAFAVGPGDTLTLDLLDAAEVAQFDVGFGEPDGPTVDLTVTGVVRIAAAEDVGPVIATPAFAARHRAARAGDIVFARLARPYGDFAADLEPLQSSARAGAEEFAPLQLVRPDAHPDSLAASARVLVTGLAVFALVAAAVGALTVAQALGRSHAAGAADQRTEAALGLTSMQRTLGRGVPTLLAGGVAAITAGGLVAIAGRIEPLGALHDVEPAPGLAPNAALLVAGAAVVLATVFLLGCITAWHAGRPEQASPVRPPVTPPVVARRPWSLAGLALLRARGVPVRSSVAGIVVGVAGAVAALTFASSLDRLGAQPSRYGWAADFGIVDAKDDIVAALRADERIDRVALLHSATVDVGGATLDGYGVEDVVGATPWTMLDGRMPVRDDEVVLGGDAARRFDAVVGDDVGELRLVGIGIGPTSFGKSLGNQALFTPRGLERLASAQTIVDALVTVKAGVDGDTVADEYAARYEVSRDDPPREVDDLLELGALPQVLAAFLIAVATLALAHTLVVATRRRRRDIAVLRAVGFTPRQAGGAVAAAGAVVAVGSVLVGVPLGLAVGRLLWWVAADGVGVGTDLAVPWRALGLLVPGVLLAVLAAAAVPAWRATTVPPALALRTE